MAVLAGTEMGVHGGTADGVVAGCDKRSGGGGRSVTQGGTQDCNKHTDCNVFGSCRFAAARAIFVVPVPATGNHGEVLEWLNRTVSKTVVPARVP